MIRDYSVANKKAPHKALCNKKAGMAALSDNSGGNSRVAYGMMGSAAEDGSMTLKEALGVAKHKQGVAQHVHGMCVAPYSRAGSESLRLNNKTGKEHNMSTALCNGAGSKTSYLHDEMDMRHNNVT